MGRILKGSHGGPVINGCEKEIQTHWRGTPPTSCGSNSTPVATKNRRDGQDSHKKLSKEGDQVKTGWYTEAIEEGGMDRTPS